MNSRKNKNKTKYSKPKEKYRKNTKLKLRAPLVFRAPTTQNKSPGSRENKISSVVVFYSPNGSIKLYMLGVKWILSSWHHTNVQSFKKKPWTTVVALKIWDTESKFTILCFWGKINPPFHIYRRREQASGSRSHAKLLLGIPGHEAWSLQITRNERMYLVIYLSSLTP